MNSPAATAPNPQPAAQRLDVLFRHVVTTPQGRYLLELVRQYRKEAAQ